MILNNKRLKQSDIDKINRINAKKTLYESIMRNVSKIIRKHLNESSSDSTSNQFLNLFNITNKSAERKAAGTFWNILSEAAASKPYILPVDKSKLYKKFVDKLQVRLTTDEFNHIIKTYAKDASTLSKNILDNEYEIHQLEFDNNPTSKKYNITGFTTKTDEGKAKKAKDYKDVTVGRAYTLDEIPYIDDLEDDEQIILVRSDNGKSEPLGYKYKGKNLKQSIINRYKWVYALVDCYPKISYYAARPIKWKTVENNEKRQWEPDKRERKEDFLK